MLTIPPFMWTLRVACRRTLGIGIARVQRNFGHPEPPGSFPAGTTAPNRLRGCLLIGGRTRETVDVKRTADLREGPSAVLSSTSSAMSWAFLGSSM